jgi:hypothetical protein
MEWGFAIGFSLSDLGSYWIFLFLWFMHCIGSGRDTKGLGMSFHVWKRISLMVRLEFM